MWLLRSCAAVVEQTYIESLLREGSRGIQADRLRLPSGVAAAASLSHKKRLCASFSIFLIRYLEIQSFFVRLLWPLKKYS